MELSRLSVATSGYECVEVEGQHVVRAISPHSLVAIETDSDGLHYPVRCGEESRKDALRVVNLHRVFGNVGNTPETVVSFANKYGLLGLPDTRKGRTLEGGSPITQDMESLAAWYREVERIKVRVRLYDIRALDCASQYVHWLGRGYRVSYELGESSYAMETFDPECAVEKGDTQGAILSSLRTSINEELRNKVSAFLGDACLMFLPRTMLGAIWLSFAREVAEMRVRRTCQNCGRGFWNAKRSDAHYCSGRCRTAACRKRKGHAF